MAESIREEIKSLRLGRLFDRVRCAVREAVPLSEEDVYNMVYPSPSRRAILIYADFDGVVELPDKLHLSEADRRRATGEILKRLEKLGLSWVLEYDHGHFFYTIRPG